MTERHRRRKDDISDCQRLRLLRQAIREANRKLGNCPSSCEVRNDMMNLLEIAELLCVGLNGDGDEVQQQAGH